MVIHTRTNRQHSKQRRLRTVVRCVAARGRAAVGLEAAGVAAAGVAAGVDTHPMVAEDLLGRLRGLCERHMGNCELVLHLKNGGEKDAIVRSRTIRVNPCDDLLRGIDDLIGPRRTWLTAQIQAPTVQVAEASRFGNREASF